VAHSVDGFELKFTGRKSWKAARYANGRLIDIVPVTWTKGRRQDPGSNEIFQEVWYQARTELEQRNTDPTPFVVALAIAKDYAEMPHQFKEFRGVFEVAPTGRLLSENSLETKVLRRVKAA
jgi:hypothetical protein